MNIYFPFTLSILLTCSASLGFAQAKKDSIVKELTLKEVEIQTIKKNKHPKTAFYQSSMLSGTEDILSKIEGVSLIRRGSIGMEPVLRGFSAGQVNVVIDGMKIFGACTDKMDPATIYTEPINLKSIDIRYGGDGIAMGATIGGTLNLKLADALIDSNIRFTGSLASGYYSAAAATQNVVAMNYSAEKWALRISGVYRKAGNYTDGGRQKVAYSQYEKANASLSGKYKLNENSTIKADLILDNGWNIGFPALPMDVGYARAKIASLTYQKQNQGSALQYIETKLYANAVRHAMDDTKRSSVSMHMDMPGQSDTWGAFFQFKLKPIGKHIINLKTDFYYNSVKADMTMFPQGGAPMYMQTWPKNYQMVTGIFVEDEVFFNQKSRLTFKLRLEGIRAGLSEEMGRDQFAVLGYNVTPSVSRILKNVNISYTHVLSPLISLYVGAGFNERSPSTSERYGFYLFNRMDSHDYVGNPLLKNEEAFNSEINLLLAADQLSWKLSAFNSLVNNYIQGITHSSLEVMTPGASGVRAYTNISSARLYGAESSFNFQCLNRHLMFNHTLKWLRGRDNKNEPLPLIAPLKSISSIRFVHDKSFIQIENELSFRQTEFNLDFGEASTPGYMLFNLRSGYGFNMKKYRLDFSAGIENVFDKEYAEHLDWGRIYRPGRNFFSMLTLKF